MRVKKSLIYIKIKLFESFMHHLLKNYLFIIENKFLKA